MIRFSVSTTLPLQTVKEVPLYLADRLFHQRCSVNIEGSACFEVDCIRTALYLYFSGSKLVEVTKELR